MSAAIPSPELEECCRYCREDAVGTDALGRWACEAHMNECADFLPQHASDCATNNEPALPRGGGCDCRGALAPKGDHVDA